MNATRTLRELLEEASGYGELSTRQLEIKLRSAVERGQIKARLNRATIAQILNGSYRKKPSDDTIRAIAYLAGVDDAVAFTAAGRRIPGRPFAEDLPPGVDDLTPKEREAAVYMLRVLVRQRQELNAHEDQNPARTPHNPPTDGTPRPHGTPMTVVPDPDAWAGRTAARHLDPDDPSAPGAHDPFKENNDHP